MITGPLPPLFKKKQQKKRVPDPWPGKKVYLTLGHEKKVHPTLDQKSIARVANMNMFLGGSFTR